MFTKEAIDIFMKTLYVMGFGMLGIFLVIGILSVSVYVLSKIPSKGEKEKG